MNRSHANKTVSDIAQFDLLRQRAASPIKVILIGFEATSISYEQFGWTVHAFNGLLERPRRSFLVFRTFS